MQGTAIWGVPAPQPLAFLRDVSGEERVADRRPWLLHRRRLNPLVVGRFDRVIRSIEAILDEEPALGPYLLEGVLRRVLVDHPGVVLASTVRLERGRTLGRHFEWNMKRMQEIRDLLEIEGFPPNRLDHAVISNSRLMRKLRRRPAGRDPCLAPVQHAPGSRPREPVRVLHEARRRGRPGQSVGRILGRLFRFNARERIVRARAVGNGVHYRRGAVGMLRG